MYCSTACRRIHTMSNTPSPSAALEFRGVRHDAMEAGDAPLNGAEYARRRSLCSSLAAAVPTKPNRRASEVIRARTDMSDGKVRRRPLAYEDSVLDPKMRTRRADVGLAAAALMARRCGSGEVSTMVRMGGCPPGWFLAGLKMQRPARAQQMCTLTSPAPAVKAR